MKPPKIKGLSFFKTGTNRRFSFPARYYDERKEEMDQRYEKMREEVKKEQNLSTDQRQELKQIMSDSWRNNSYRVQSRNSIIRFSVILVMLIILVVIFGYGFLQMEPNG